MSHLELSPPIAFGGALATVLLVHRLGSLILAEVARARMLGLPDEVESNWFWLIWMVQPLASAVGGCFWAISTRQPRYSILLAMLVPLPIYVLWIRAAFVGRGLLELFVHLGLNAGLAIISWRLCRRVQRY